MTPRELARSGRLPFLLAFFVGLVGMPLDIFAFNEREIGTAHAAPWRSRTAAALTRAITSLLQRAVAFLRSPKGQQIALATAVLLLALTVMHGQAVVMAAGLTIPGTLPECRELKGRLANEADEILKKAGEDGRHDLRKEEDEKFDAIHADIETLTRHITRLEKQATVNASLVETQNGGRRSEHNPQETRQSSTTRSFGKLTEHDRVEGLRAWMLAGSAEVQPTEEMRERARRCGISLESNRFSMRFGPKALRSGQSDEVRKWQAGIDEERAALTGAQGTTTTGGYTVPDATMQALEFALLAFGGMRAVSTELRTDTGGPLPIPTSDDTANKGALLAENTAVTELEMTFGQLVLDAFKYSSKSILASVEFLQDSSINVGEFIGTALGNRIGRVTNDDFTTANGSSKPNGVINAATSSAVTLSGVASISYDNIMDLIHSVDPAYRDNGRFMFHDGGLKMIKKTKVLQYSGDATGVPLWQPSLVAGQPDLIHGYPYTINQSMTTPATGVKSILFGDFSKYLIRTVRDFTLLRLDERYAELHQVGFLAFVRCDGDLLDAGTHPIKYATQA